MLIYLKVPFWTRNLITILTLTGAALGILPFFEGQSAKLQADEMAKIAGSDELSSILISQDSSLLPLASPNNPEPAVSQKIGAVITAYSSTVWQTDDTPHITASGTWVRDGIIANNYLALGTRVRIPELFGDKIFVVEDRMNWRKGNYTFDIWFADYWQALNFGAKRTYIEVLES